MNGQTLNGIENQPHPTAVHTSLPGVASFARYDPSGKFILGASKNDRHEGSCAVWDLETNAVIREMRGHIKGIASVDWSRNSRYILTASKDWKVIVWDLASGSREPKKHSVIRFDSPVHFAMFHPRNMKIILVLLEAGDLYIVDERSEERRSELLEHGLGEEDGTEGDETEKVFQYFTCARFDPTGRYVFVGTAQSGILVFNTRSKKLVCRYKIAGAGTLKGLEFAKYGRRLVTNSSDRNLRLFNLPGSYPQELESDRDIEIEPKFLFQDPVNRFAWYNMTFSPDGAWLAGGAADQAQHKVFVWDAEEGRLSAQLDGGREPLLDITWHPKDQALASTNRLGDILLWHHPSPEKWGAFAGGFEEFDENVIYEEREDEFDLEDEEEEAERKRRQENVDVDIMTIVKVPTERELEISRELKDDDVLWAENEPDDDRDWRMKVLIVEDKPEEKPQ